jgi:hypothetical protein
MVVCIHGVGGRECLPRLTTDTPSCAIPKTCHHFEIEAAAELGATEVVFPGPGVELEAQLEIGMLQPLGTSTGYRCSAGKRYDR